MPVSIGEFRQQNPQYDDMPDDQLAGALHKKWYSDMPREEFDSKFGVSRFSEVGPFGSGDAVANATPEEQTALQEAVVKHNDPGALNTVLTQFGQVANFGFADPLRAGIRAGLGKVGLGDYGGYEDELKKVRAEEEAGVAAHPQLATAARLGGTLASGLVLPGFTAARGAGLLPRIAAGAGTGAVYGGLQAAGESNAETPGELLGAGAKGAGIGALVGGAVPAAISGAGRVVRGAGNVASRATPAGRQRLATEEAQQRVTQALERDAAIAGKAGRPGGALAQAEIELGSRTAAGQPAVLADVGGETTRALMRSAANTSPEGRQIIEDVVAPRFAEQGTRAQDAFRRIIGAEGDTAGLQELIEQTAQRTNNAAYRRAFKEGEAGIWNDDLGRLTTAPAMQTAIRNAAVSGANRATVEGFRPPVNPFRQRPDGGLELAGNATPTLEFWNAVKIELGDQISAAQRTGTKGAARDLVGLKNALLQQLDAAAPSYANARAGAASYFGAGNALQVGEHLATDTKRSINDVARGLSKMSAAERQLVQHGFANRMMQTISGQRDQRDVSGLAMFSSDLMRQRARVIFGREKSEQLRRFVEGERAMDRARGALGNSTTIRQGIEAGMAGGGMQRAAGAAERALDTLGVVGAVTSGIVHPATLAPVALRLLITAVRRGTSSGINPRVAQEVARLLASSDPQMMQRGLDLIARNRTLQNALQKIEGTVTRGAAITAQ